MSTNWKSSLRQLRNLCLFIRHQTKQAEAKVQQANALLRELRRNRVVGEMVVMGPVLFTRRYSPTPGRNDTGQVVQAVLSAEKGIGAAFWDSELYAELSQIHGGPETEVSWAFVPFKRCEPSVRAALLPQIERLVQELWQRTCEVRQGLRRQR